MKNKLLFLLTFLLVTINAKAQTILAVGDLSIIGFNGIINTFSSGPLFVCWVDLAPNTVIKFTNNAFNSANATAASQYRVSHATITWTSPSTTLSAGTVVSIIGDGSTSLTTNYGTVSAVTASLATTFGLNLASTGGNIFAFQGTGTTATAATATGTFSGTLLYGIQYAGLNSNTWLTTGQATATASWLPSTIASYGLYFGSDALAATYNGARSGLTIAQYKTAVNNAANWTTAVSPFGVTLSTTPFTTTPLAVSISSFTAEKESNTAGLYWTTLSEQDNVGFGIERSGDGKTFQSIGYVASKAKNGNSNAQLNYSFSDKTPLTGMNYYRLVEENKEGVNTYTDVRTVSFDNPSAFKAYPNPVKGQITMEHIADKAESLTVRFTDVLGKVVLEATIQAQKGFNQNQIDMGSLVHGIYNMTITNNSGLVYNARIVKN